MCLRLSVIGLYLAVVATTADAQTSVIPQRTDDNLIVAAYNIQWVGRNGTITTSWPRSSSTSTCVGSLN